MKNFNTKIEGEESGKEFSFECEENTHPIEIGDNFLFFFCGIAAVGKCMSENEKEEINPNNRKPDPNTIDLVYNFWKNCYKIRSTNFDLTTV